LLRESVSRIPSLVSHDVGRHVLDVLPVGSILILTFRNEISHFARRQFVGTQVDVSILNVRGMTPNQLW
jgi:hypothetical protein